MGLQGLSKCLTIVPKNKIKNHCLVAKFEIKKRGGFYEEKSQLGMVFLKTEL